jgi:hypothetical protein
MEIWKLIVGNCSYEVSDRGRVRLVQPDPRTAKTGGVMRLAPGGGGYLRVRLAPNNQKHLSVHRLVWQTFNGPIPAGLMINHLNGIKTDNRLENLELCTRLQNVAHAMKIGLFRPKAPTPTPHFGEDNPAARLTRDTVREIRSLRKQGMSGYSIARQLGLKDRTVYHVISGRYWSQVT